MSRACCFYLLWGAGVRENPVFRLSKWIALDHCYFLRLLQFQRNAKRSKDGLGLAPWYPKWTFRRGCVRLLYILTRLSETFTCVKKLKVETYTLFACDVTFSRHVGGETKTNWSTKSTRSTCFFIERCWMYVSFFHCVKIILHLSTFHTVSTFKQQHLPSKMADSNDCYVMYDGISSGL